MPIALALLALLQEDRALGFETDVDLAAWVVEYPHRLAPDHATEGRAALEVDLPPESWPGIALEFRDRDCSAFEFLALDVWNPTSRVLAFSIRIDDADSSGYGSRYNGEFPLRPGANPIELPLTGLRTGDGSRTLDVSRIERLILFLIEPGEPVTLTFDRVRLSRSGAPPGVSPFFAFDFGPEDSPVFPGFTAVTPDTVHTRDRGWGFESAGANSRDRRHPDELFGDWVEGSRRFLVDLPNGEYECWMGTVDAGYWDWVPHYERRRFLAEGGVVAEDVLGADRFLERYFAHLETEDVPGEDVWSIYVAPRFAPRTFTVRVADGQLTLDFDPRGSQVCVISALVIYPAASREAAGQWLADLDRRRRDRFAQRHVEVASDDDANEPTEEDRRRGYVVTCAHEAATARGESAPLVVAVRALRDLGDVRVRVDGIPARVRWAQYKLKRIGASGSAYRIRPELLREGSVARVPEGLTRLFWIDLGPAAPGDHEAGVVIDPRHGETARIDVRLRVHDIELPEPDIMMGMFYYPLGYLRWFPETEGRYFDRMTAHLEDMRAHGMTSVGAYVDAGDAARFRDLYARAGFRGPFLFGASEDPTRLASLVGEAGPDAIFMLLDEPSNEGGIGRDGARRVLEAARRVAGVRTTGALNHTGDETLFPLMDYPMFNDGMEIDDALLRRSERPILYNIGRDRYSWGCYLLKARVAGRFEFAYEVGQADPFYDLDARESDLNAAYPSPDGAPIASISWENIRQGVLDYRYGLALRERDPAALERILADVPLRLADRRDDAWCATTRARIVEALTRR